MGVAVGSDLTGLWAECRPQHPDRIQQRPTLAWVRRPRLRRPCLVEPDSNLGDPMIRCVLLAFFTVFLIVASASADEVALEKQGGTFAVPVLINGSVKLNFVLDSGASDVLIPVDVAITLARSGTLSSADFIGNQTYSLADGSTLQSVKFTLREVQVGNQILRNVVASAGPIASSPLLGQSFLSRFGAWTLDNSRHVLMLGASPTAAPTMPKFGINRKWDDLSKDDVVEFHRQCFQKVKVAALREHKRFCLLDIRKSYTSVMLDGEVETSDTIAGNDAIPTQDLKFACSLDVFGKATLLLMFKYGPAVPRDWRCHPTRESWPAPTNSTIPSHS